MNKINRQRSYKKPEVFVEYCGKFIYNHDIEVEIKFDLDNKGNELKIVEYTYIPIIIDNKNNYKDHVEEILRKYISQGQEFDLINSTNKALMGLVDEETKTRILIEYKEYLGLLDHIKGVLKKDFNQ